MQTTATVGTVKIWPVITLDSHQSHVRDGEIYDWTHEDPSIVAMWDLRVGSEVIVAEVEDPDTCRWHGTIAAIDFRRSERRDYVYLEITRGAWIR